MGQATKITIIISIFFTLFYIAFARSIIDLLYHRAFLDYPEHLSTATRLLKIESALIFLMGISAVFTAMLQGMDKAKFPLISLLIGGALKIAFQFSLIKGPLGIYAVSIGNVICFFAAAVLNAIFALYFVKTKNIKLWAVKFAGLTATFGFVILVLFHIMPENRWWVLLSGFVAFTMYVILLYFFGFLRFTKVPDGDNPKEVKGENENEKERISGNSCRQT